MYNMALNGPPPPLVLIKQNPDLPNGMTMNDYINLKKSATILLGSPDANMTNDERIILMNNLHSAHPDHITLLDDTVNIIMGRPSLGGRRRHTRHNKKSKRSKRSKRSTRRR